LSIFFSCDVSENDYCTSDNAGLEYRRAGVLDKKRFAILFPEDLSGGEKQRVAVARALIRNPQLILADEPTASLDDLSAGLVKEAIATAARTTSCAALVVTHDPRLFEIADRVLRLENGNLSEA